ncbi:hypothetical protein DLM75_19475 [Leptospira stimsonii]|uniref:Uncharacterized protein n=1 Tax=Leptospira stimsonii TaxID=2202203 RepID=A0A396YR57_9LEPT|nr:hypothetical protein DLM75_19475 [Leptospira stimsonii]
MIYGNLFLSAGKDSHSTHGSSAELETISSHGLSLRRDPICKFGHGSVKRKGASRIDPNSKYEPRKGGAYQTKIREERMIPALGSDVIFPPTSFPKAKRSR